ncbi:Hypothetical predicted protein [Cloeon dipterum]|uniref:Beta-hexosaminidase bacterial type N-terminal domain-containing protein n=1 Tax=Cloeon dipterum TaxID=197152 RepID=A0A8S1BU26_9INSE|nr:Hypothetical predicted protein [Cloeon dipterum]
MMDSDLISNIKSAIEQGRSDIVRTLLEACDKGQEGLTKDKVLNSPLIDGGTLLLYATKLDQGDVVRTLLSAGADPGIQNSAGENALDTAGTIHMKQIYVDELLRATGTSDVGRVCQLIAAGLSVNSYDSEESRNTPLHWAASYGNRDIVSCLIHRGANVNAMNSCGATPLHDAVSQNNVEIAEELLQGGANPLIQAVRGKFSGQTSLDLACNKMELASLLERYTSFNAKPNMPADMNGGLSVEASGRLRAASVRSLSSEMFESFDSTRKISYAPFSPTSPLSKGTLSPQFEHVAEKLASCNLKSPVTPIVTRTSLQLLWPQPQRIQELPGTSFVPDGKVHVMVHPSTEPILKILDIWEASRAALQAVKFSVMVGGVHPPGGGLSNKEVNSIECCVSDKIFSSVNMYQLHITSNIIKISAGSLCALHYALVTLTQLIRLSIDEDGLAPVIIQDHPVLSHRGALIDISPLSRIPSLECLFNKIETWSQLKMNYLHLYTRLRPSSDWQLSYSKSELMSVARYCQDRFLTLVPVLDVEDCVEESQLSLMWPVFQQLVASFPNVELIHIGPRLSSLLLPQQTPNVWHLLTLPTHVTLMLCCNNLAQSYDLPPNVILMEYGFQADYDFLGKVRPHLDEGRAICLCPGTASWNSLAGCPEAALCNILTSVQVAVQSGTLGIVAANWSGPHHLTPYPFSWPGFVVAAGLSWNSSAHWEFVHSSLAPLLDAHVFLDTQGHIGQAILELGHADTLALRASRGQATADQSDLPAPSCSLLHCLLTEPNNVSLEFLTPELFARVTKHVKRCQASLLRAHLHCHYSEMVLQELQLTADLMITACRIGRALLSVGMNPNSNMGLSVINLGVTNLPPTFRTDIANKLLALIEQYRGTWLQRHLPAGLQTSLVALTQVLNSFVPDDNVNS